MAEPDTIPSRGKRRRLRRTRTLLVLGLLVVVAVWAGFVLMGRTLTAPDWVVQRVEARASEVGVRADFSRLDFVVNKGWRPRVRLVDLTLSTSEGAPIARLSRVEASLSMRALLRGQVHPRDVELSGVVARLRRAQNGAITLSGGTDLGTVQREATSLRELIGSVDSALEYPALAQLRSVDIFGLTLEFQDARVGRTWTADGGRVRLDRNGDDLTLSADLALLGGGAGVATLEANYTSRIGETAASFGIRMDGVRAADIATQGPALAWLAPLDASISGALRSGVRADGSLSPLSATLQIGKGVLQPNAETRAIPFDSARSYFTYDSATRTMQLSELSLNSDWFTGQVEGQALLTGTDPARFDALIAQLSANSLSFNPFDLYTAPVALDGVQLDLRLTLDPFRIELGEGLIRDKGQVLSARGDLTAQRDGWRFGLDAQMDAVTRDRLLALWPQNLVPGTRRWLDANLLGGELSGIDLSLRGAPGAKPDAYLSFDFAGAEVRYARTLPPITGGAGNASLLRNRFALTLDAGTVTPAQGGVLNVAGSSFIIPDVAVKGGPPSVTRLDVSGPIEAALSLLDNEPLTVMADADLPVALAAGTAEVSATLDIPLKKDLLAKEVRFDARGTLRNVQSDVLLEGRSLSAQTLQVIARNDGLRIGGRGTLDGLPFDAAWTQPLGPEAKAGSRIDGEVELSPRTLSTFGIALPPGSVTGQGSGRFSVDLPRGAPPRLALRSDLKGVRLALAPLGWGKGAGQSGTLEIGATLGKQPDVDKLRLDAPGLSATGKIALTDSGAMASAVFDRVQVGGWLDAPVILTSRGKGQPPTVRLQGGKIDLRAAQFGKGGGGGGNLSSPLELKLDRLQIADTIAITEMEGAFVTGAGLDGRFTGRINGGAQVSGRVVPQGGRSAIQLQSDNAGGVFASAGIIRQARGGALNLTLVPVGQEGAFDGSLRVKNTRIKDAPAIADLISAVSVVGLLEQLSGEGILFSEVEARFRLTPSVLTLSSASAVGPSLGLSMDGRYGIKGAVLDMQGAISPIYLLNGIGSIFTRKGEGLIAFTYRLTGRAEDPKVSVNPLSALTPGLFRDIFRRPPPDLPQTDGEAEIPRAFTPEPSVPKVKTPSYEGR